jgi:hypothetical protein
VKFIDPTGMFIDDYFNEFGKYLGTDNSVSQNIRIIPQKQFELNKEELVDANGIIEASLATQMSELHSTAAISTDASLSIFQHYNPTDLPLNDVRSDNPSSEIDTRFRVSPRTQKAVDIGIDVKGFKAMEISDNIPEIKNILVHEKQHYSDFKTLGYDAYNALEKNSLEQRAVTAQIKDPSFKQMRLKIQNSIIKYGNDFGLPTPLKSTPLFINSNQRR